MIKILERSGIHFPFSTEVVRPLWLP
jgi:hypothetical protein